MSRQVNAGSELDANLVSGSNAFTHFCWVKATDLLPSSGQKIYQRVSAANVLAASGVIDGWVGQVNYGAFNFRLITPENAYDGQWVPIMITNQTGTDNARFYIGDPAANPPALAEGLAGSVLDLIKLGEQSTAPMKYAHSAAWDRVLSQAEYTQLITVNGGTGLTPNPATLFPTNLINYLSFTVDTLISEAGSELVTWTGATSTFDDADNPPVEPFGDVPPVFIDPGVQTYKIDTAIASVDTRTWFSASNSVSVVNNDALPSGLTLVDSILSGTPDVAGDVTTSFTATDTVTLAASDPSGVSFTVNPYQLVFNTADTTALVDENGVTKNTAGIVATVFSGWVTAGDALTAFQNFPGPFTITNGALTLSPITAGAGNYTVIVKDTDEGAVVPLCARELTAQ